MQPLASTWDDLDSITVGVSMWRCARALDNWVALNPPAVNRLHQTDQSAGFNTRTWQRNTTRL